MSPTERTGLLLINLGTPESPSTSDVRAYLREFLNDPRVIDVAGWRRWLLLNLLILPFRPKKSAEAYRKVWSDKGSPLMQFSEAFTAKIAARLPELEVVLAMRYGKPAIAAGLAELRARGVGRIVVFPLYPQYSSAANGSSMEEVVRLASAEAAFPQLQFIPPFYDDPGFISANVALARPIIEELQPERVFFSFHGLPERQVRATDPSGSHCLNSDGCCDRIGHANRDCYRAQCYATARLMAAELQLKPEQSIVCFQSRLGRTPWIRPYTDELIEEEARRGCRKAVILSPAFVADCLETLEELGLRAVESWRAAGGETLRLVPCINADDRWVEAAIAIAQRESSWIASASAAAAPLDLQLNRG